MSKLTIRHDRVWFWSDPHFWHAKMAVSRGFDTVEAMNEALIEKARKGMPRDATLVLLGDISFAGAARTLDVLDAIPCRKVLVRGNHDKAMNGQVLAHFESAHDLLTLKVELPEPGQLQRIVCCHFPMLSWDMQHYGAWHLHGHSHGSMRYPWSDAKILDVGVDTLLGTDGPISFDKILSVMNARVIRSNDYHEARA